MDVLFAFLRSLICDNIRVLRNKGDVDAEDSYIRYGWNAGGH